MSAYHLWNTGDFPVVQLVGQVEDPQTVVVAARQYARPVRRPDNTTNIPHCFQPIQVGPG